ncbi:hypothetical protein P7K49_004309 [Saguinus oedipus]|uniref:Uncharacterized protein n=1 Tax=Saguinus oedipus TaxID=9490 RepID=A0ABQ9W709_SAGOE|nr:hypothetical protein P7K49_004309 [Saguinus oedipus]
MRLGTAGPETYSVRSASVESEYCRTHGCWLPVVKCEDSEDGRRLSEGSAPSPAVGETSGAAHEGSLGVQRSTVSCLRATARALSGYGHTGLVACDVACDVACSLICTPAPGFCDLRKWLEAHSLDQRNSCALPAAASLVFTGSEEMHFFVVLFALLQGQLCPTGWTCLLCKAGHVLLADEQTYRQAHSTADSGAEASHSRSRVSHPTPGGERRFKGPSGGSLSWEQGQVKSGSRGTFTEVICYPQDPQSLTEVYYEEEVYDEEVCDEEVCDEEVYDEEVCDEEVCDEEVCDEEVCDEEVCDEEVCDEEVCDEEVCDEEVCDEEVCDEEVCDEEVCDEEVCDEEVCDEEVCDEEVCDEEVCDEEVCDEEVCDEEVCDEEVCDEEVCDEEVCDEEVCDEEVCDEEVCDEEVCDEEVCDEEVCDEEVCDEEVCDEEVCDEEVCDEEVCDEEVCDEEVCEEEVYDEEVCDEEVCDEEVYD